MHTNNERGIALVLALFLMTALSVLGASLMFLAQTETYATMNYRMMSQARYAGEAGVQKASGFLLDSAQYPLPGPGSVTDPITNYDTTKSPVVCKAGVAGCTAGQAVILSASASQASNYPVAAIKTAFSAAAQGSLTAGNATITYNSYAKLIAMQSFDSYGGGAAIIQTWEITGVGGLTGSRNATVQVVAVVETPKVSANSYAAFATANTCGAIYFHGNVSVDSYDSSTGLPPGGSPGPGNSTLFSGGDVGTNGNLEIQGSVGIYGNLYTPRTGVGACTAGAVTALTETGSATLYGEDGTSGVNDKPIALPTAVAYPPPVFSTIPPTTAVTIANNLLNPAGLPGTPVTAVASCAALGLVYGDNTGLPGHPAGNCDLKTTGGASALASAIGPYTNVVVSGHGTDVTMPSVTVSGGYKLTIAGYTNPITGAGKAQNININALNGSGAVEVATNMVTNTNESIVLKVAGKNPPGILSALADPTDMDPPFDLSLMTWKQNSPVASYDASALQIVYPGTGTISMKGGNSQSAATIYAPNAAFSLQGTQDLYGSILAKTITNGGNASIHYDRRLGHDFWVAGHPMVGSFTWTRY